MNSFEIKLPERAKPRIEVGDTAVVVDFKGVNHLTPTDLNKIFTDTKEARRGGRKLLLVNARAVRKLLESRGLDEIGDVYDEDAERTPKSHDPFLH